MVSAFAPRAWPPAPTRAPAATWARYVDAARSHEVVATWDPTRGVHVVREQALREPGPPLVDATPAARAWEAQVARYALESRLALLGTYWRQRAGEPGWTRVGAPAGAMRPDLRAAEVFPAERGVLMHHHDATGRLDLLVAALREGDRFNVVRADVDVPALEVGRIAFLAEGVSAPLMRSLLAREELALAPARMPKLVTREDYATAFGEDAAERALRLLDELVHRAANRQLERPARVVEGGEPMAEFLAALRDPRLLALHARHLEPGEDAALVEGGHVAIHRHVQRLRSKTGHAEQHLLTILEASLVARAAMRSRRLVASDPEVRALTRLAYYL